MKKQRPCNAHTRFWFYKERVNPFLYTSLGTV